MIELYVPVALALIEQGILFMLLLPCAFRHIKGFCVVIKDHTNRLSYLEDPKENELYQVNGSPKMEISLNPE